MTVAFKAIESDPQAEFALAQAALFGGRPAEAVERLEALVRAAPQQPVIAYWLAAARGAAGDWKGFDAGLDAARELHVEGLLARTNPDLATLVRDPGHAWRCAQGLYADGMVAIASQLLVRTATVPQPPAEVFVRLGLALQHQGRVEEALDAFTRAGEADPDSSQIRSLRLYILFHVEDGVRRHAEAAVNWSRAYAADAEPTAFANPSLAGRALRVGYMSPSIDNQLRQFLDPVLEHHDRARVHVTLYVNAAPMTPARADRLRVIGHLSDAEAARQVQADGIDVLVDLWGHTTGSRLGVFALKPAPVQASWMNYVQTTGLEAMDYLLHPDCLAAPGAQEACVERIWPIGSVMSPFRPGVRPKPVPTPAKAAGYVTFGSYNHPVRLNAPTVDAWARILRRVPHSRLVLRYRYFMDEVLQNVTLMRFAARGVEPHRIAFHGELAQPAYYESYREIDIALDPGRCPGGTTSMDAVANGVPLVTYAGADYYARLGVAVLAPLGLDELVTETWDAYVEKAVALASDIEALDVLRGRVRRAFDASPRRDEVGFTAMIEDQFHRMFQIWRDGS